MSRAPQQAHGIADDDQHRTLVEQHADGHGHAAHEHAGEQDGYGAQREKRSMNFCVCALAFCAPLPAITSPSTGTLAPFLTSTTSPMATLPAGTSTCSRPGA